MSQGKSWLDINLDETTNDSRRTRPIDNLIIDDDYERTGKICPELTIAFQDYTECIGEQCQQWEDGDCGKKRNSNE